LRRSIVRSRRLASVVDAVGETPLVRLPHVAREAPSVEVYLKLEFANPGGSVKDRAALRMMLSAIKDGRLTSDKTLIDSTSGNTGVAYSIFGAALGHPVALVMPSNVSRARKLITRAFGTELIFSDPMEGSDGAIRLVREIVAKEPDKWFYPDQYSNPDNPLAHYHGTGAEILDALGDRITHFVAGLGTSGTIMGTSRRLREHSRPIKLHRGRADRALHGLEGLKHLPSSLVPQIHDSRATTRRCASRPRTAGIWPTGSRARRRSTWGTRRARRCSRRRGGEAAPQRAAGRLRRDDRVRSGDRYFAR
jgi:cysteine synthase B